MTQESKLSQKRKAKKPEARCAYKLNEHRLLGVSENEDMVVSKGETEVSSKGRSRKFKISAENGESD